MYTDVATLLLKIVFHHPFMNELNVHNQVGLVALNCMGEMAFQDRRLNQTLADDDASFSPLLGLQSARAQSTNFLGHQLAIPHHP